MKLATIRLNLILLATYSISSIGLDPILSAAQIQSARSAFSPKKQTAQVSEGATIKGQVEFNKDRSTSWKGSQLSLPLEEIPTKLFQQIELPPVPVPENWMAMKPDEQQAWAKAFEESAEGKAFIEDREKRIEAAKDFDVIIEKNGKFVVYDVPVGVYGLRGRVDKEFDGTLFGFEIFGQIEVVKGMDEVRLPPLDVTITPMLKSGEKAPPIAVATFDKSTTIELDAFKDHYLLLNFWITNSPSAVYQTSIQEAFAKIKDKYPLRLLSICVDEDASDAGKFILEKELKLGSHGFTGGFEHRTMFDYGVRAIPSFWLIAPDGKITMSQYDFATAFRLQSDLGEIISNRIEGKDVPTPNENAKSDGQ